MQDSTFLLKKRGSNIMGITRYFEDFSIGETVTTHARKIEMADIRMYSACTSLCARIHSDPIYCEHIPELRSISVPYSLALNVIDGFFAQSISPEGVATFHYGYDDVRYGDVIYPGDVIHSEFELVDKQIKNEKFGVLVFKAITRNQNGAIVISHIDKLYCERKAE